MNSLVQDVRNSQALQARMTRKGAEKGGAGGGGADQLVGPMTTRPQSNRPVISQLQQTLFFVCVLAGVAGVHPTLKILPEARGLPRVC